MQRNFKNTKGETVIFTKILSFWRNASKKPGTRHYDKSRPNIIPRDKHPISRKNISNNALKVLHRLSSAGYEAYLVGGGVRDLLLGLKPKDFDIATNATPEEVKSLFRNCRLIGRRFRLAHVYFGRDIIEVATFRGHHKPEHQQKHRTESGMLLRDNVYGTIDEDVLRRDFTVNALYYNIKDFSIVDFVDGIKDIGERKLHLIGDTETRYREDPVRMLRAVRLSAKLGLAVDDASAQLIPQLADLLNDVPKARLWDESLKLFLGGHAFDTLEKLKQLKLFHRLFPLTEEHLNPSNGEPDPVATRFIKIALENTDKRIANGRPVTPAFLYAALLWYPTATRTEQYMHDGLPQMEAFHKACTQVLTEQQNAITIPKRFSIVIREIWSMQFQLIRRHGKRAESLLSQARFRASYDFLLIRSEAGEPLEELAQWWTQFQEVDDSGRREMIRALTPASKRRRRRPKRNSTKRNTP